MLVRVWSWWWDSVGRSWTAFYYVHLNIIYCYKDFVTSSWLKKELISYYVQYKKVFIIFLIKGLHGFWNFEKSVLFIIFYKIIQHVKNIFPKFRVDRSKILRETFEIPSHSDLYWLPFWTRFSQNWIFKVGGHNFLKTNSPILLKFCTLF